MNQTIDVLMNHKSIRKYKKECPSEEIIQTIVKAGQQAAFACQVYSFLLSRDAEKNHFNAPLQFYICVDMHKFEKIMEKRNWETKMCDSFLMILGMQDAGYAAQNLVIAAESLGLGTCYLGFVPYMAEKIRAQFELPSRIFPMVGLTVGYPDENPPVRPRYPMDYTLYDGKYGELSDEQVENAMKVMDEGYLAQDYYRKVNYMVKLEEGREETFDFDTYSWTEHISRKMGQMGTRSEILINKLQDCGFDLSK